MEAQKTLNRIAASVRVIRNSKEKLAKSPTWTAQETQKTLNRVADIRLRWLRCEKDRADQKNQSSKRCDPRGLGNPVPSASWGCHSSDGGWENDKYLSAKIHQ